MSETTDELLAKVEDALWIGDQRAAGILLHRILLQDFTNRQAWQLLHSMRGGELTLKAFQLSFAQRYYPHLAHLLSDAPPPLSESAWVPELAAPAFKPIPAVKPVKPFIEPIEEEEEAADEELEALIPSARPLFEVPEPLVRGARPAETVRPGIEPVETSVEAGKEAVEAAQTPQDLPYCPTCGKSYPADAHFCDICGAVLVRTGDVKSPLAAPVEILAEEPEPDTQPIPVELKASATAAEIPSPSAPAVPPRLESGSVVSQVIRPVELQPAAPAVVTAPVAAAATGSLTITRENSLAGALFMYTIWVNGQERGKVGNNKLITLSLPAGQHTIQVTQGRHASPPLAIELSPGSKVQLYCQPPKTKTGGPRVTLLSAGRPMPVKTRWWAGWLLLLLILACLAAGVGTVVYYFMTVAG